MRLQSGSVTGTNSGVNRSPTRVERYLAHLDRLFGGAEPRFEPVGASPPGRGRTTAIIYVDLPDPGQLTAFTYGLSLAEHPSWQLGKPELMITVRSRNIAWGLAIGYLADGLRGLCPFSYGDTVDFGEISTESAMTGFLVFAPTVLEPIDYRGIALGDTSVSLACCYPIHQVEMDYIARHGVGSFWKLDWDHLDVTRAPAI